MIVMPGLWRPGNQRRKILDNVKLTGLRKADRKATEVYIDRIQHRVAEM